MTAIDVLTKQTQDAHSWTNKLLDSIPITHWNDTPDIMESNINWQLGHLIISEFYHAILVITGFNDEVSAKIDLKELNLNYGYGSVPQNDIAETKLENLRKQLEFMQSMVIKTISTLSEQDLECKVEQPIDRKHPVAITKFDALSWNIKHTMWHCGQIAALKRIIHEGYDFGL